MAPPGVAAMAAFSVPGIRDVVAVPTASDSKGQSQRDTGERSRTRACPTGKCRWGCLDSPGGATPVTRINARGSVAVRWELESMSQAKLVRDKIPQIIRDTGAEPVTRVADVEEYRKLHHLEKLRTAKAVQRGGFADRIVWSGNAPTGGHATYVGLTSSA